MSENKENSVKSASALREEVVLEFWKENKIFQKSLEKKSIKGDFVFYEGPPTANGKPGIHHLEARAFKDVIPRYKTMQGYYVGRKGGWDTHGLPVELQVEKALGLKSKKEIEEYGIAKFNQKCKESVWEYLEFWNKFTERIGFWVDQENPYVTYHNNYIESVWNVIKEVEKQDLLYKDYKVVPWCPRCGTTLSSHELAQGYENVKDLSVYAKFKLKNEENTFILAWTTTPWTLPGNVALAIGEKIDYVKIKPLPSPLLSGEGKGEVYLILAKARLSQVEVEYEIVEELKGKDLVGLEYEPLYPFLKEQLEKKGESTDKAFKVYPANFVTTEDGTGVVHTAVMYGQDDFVLGTEIGLPKHHLVGLDGKFLTGTGFLEGRFVRDEEVAVDVIKDLAHRGLLFKKEKYEHSYPHCWRCKTALIYYARDSWYIRMSSLRDKLVSENEGINWEPAHIKEGRFGEWLREVKDWAISRERYWGTPLPVWHCDKCKKIEVIGSIEDLKNKTKNSGNKYFAMRHGEAESNIKVPGGIISTLKENYDPLTENGIKQVEESAKYLKNKKIDLIIYSDFLRTKQTAEIIKKGLNIKDENFISDKRIWELACGALEGKSWDDYLKDRKDQSEYFYCPDGGESFSDVKKRATEFIFDINKKYQNKNILIISHELPVRLIVFGARYLNDSNIQKQMETIPMIKNAEILEFNVDSLPHNENYELDLHRPYIDEIELACSCGEKLERTKEVMDVWLDSGTMPFSQDHFPFETHPVPPKGMVEINDLKYPADFISEAIDQTRGWFYTLHAVGVLMGRGKAFKNVICLGHLLDAKGKKMSKSIGNVVDPWEMIEKYGVDTLRLWMYAVNQPGESKNFDEKTVAELHNKVFNLLYNVIAFYELYRDSSLETRTYKLETNSNILDKWIVSRLVELTDECTQKLDDYKILEPVRAIRDFIDDLSTWYLRRSRERIKEGDVDAKKTLYYVLKNLSKLMAPFAPFSAEDIWQKLKNDADEESVHLASWPILSQGDEGQAKIIEDMEQVRNIVTLGLQARQKAGIPVRQPLGKLQIKNNELREEYLELIKDEINVREIISDKNIDGEVLLDIEINEELKQEGNYRELLRAIQDMRKKAGLTPSDVITLSVETNEEGKKLIQKFENEIKKIALSEKIEFKQNDGQEVKIDNLSFKISIQK